MSDAVPTPDFPITKRTEWFWVRVAVSIFFALLAVAFASWWLRSIHCCDRIILKTTTKLLYVTSERSVIELLYICPKPDDDGVVRFEPLVTEPILRTSSITSPPARNFDWDSNEVVTTIAVPHSVLAAIAACLSVVSWFPTRFPICVTSLAASLVAVVLGLMMWAVK
jgi:hypothetical protein